MLAAKNGDSQAFTLIIQGYERRLYQAAYSFLRDMEDAADVVQDTLFRAYKNFNSFDETRPLYPWLYRITKNLCINRVKSRHRHAVGPIITEPVDERSMPEADVLKREECRRIRQCVEGLPEQAREIIMLKHFQECSYAEIAEILEIPPGTVMSRLYNARKLLRKVLEREA